MEAGLGDKIAIYWEGNEPGCDGTLTYSELLQKVCQVDTMLTCIMLLASMLDHEVVSVKRCSVNCDW